MSKQTSSENTSRKPKRKNGEGSIYWDKHIGKYVAACTDINGIRHRARFGNEDDAQAWRTAQKEAREKGEGTFVRDPKSTLADYLNEWLLARKGISRNTIRFYDQTIKNRINPYIGHLKLKNIKPKVIEDFLNFLIIEKNFQGGTVRGVVRTMNKAFTDGVRWGDLPHNVMTKVVIPKLESNPSPRIPARDVSKLRFHATSNAYDAARLEIGVAIGLRPGEVAGLKWKDFNPEDRTLKIERQIQRYTGLGLVEEKTKTKKIKIVPLLAHEIELLKNLYRFQATGQKVKRIISQEDYIFPNSVGKAMDPTFDRKWFRRLCDTAEIPRYQKFQMRKTAFTDLSHVTDLATVKKYSGHTQISTLINHYIDPEQVEVRAALERRHSKQVEISNTSNG
jgi:integrase